MEKKIFFNPIINNTATFIKTSEETNGEYSLIEIELHKSKGPPLHFHKLFSEKFDIIEGSLYLSMHVGLTILYLAVSSFIGNWWNIILLPLLLLIVQEYIIKREEKYLVREFSQQYKVYN